MLNLTIDNINVQVEEGATILDAAKKAGIYIPTLCYREDLKPMGVCRLCVVEVKGAKTLQAACVTPASEGMIVKTNSPFIRKARKTILELILSNHPMECPACIRNGNCELQEMASRLNITDIKYSGEKNIFNRDETTPAIVRDPNKCILCRRCVNVCGEIQGIGIIEPHHRGFNTSIDPPFNQGLSKMPCAQCGQCVLVCPTGALTERDDTDKVFDALSDPQKYVIAQTAPAVRVALGEAFGMEPGSIVTGQMVAALRKMGFYRIFDTNFTADLTIIEEASELVERLEQGGKMPLITSCSPGWIKFCEHFYPELLDNLSTCKSPQQMMGALIKTYYAAKNRIPPQNIVVVSIMPCTAKKFEAQRGEMVSSGYQDVDIVITTRELARMIREMNIDILKLKPEDYDFPLGISTGAGAIFGATGGVMEAALRTAYYFLTGEELKHVEIHPVRGMEGIKEVEVEIKNLKIKAAVAHGLKNARKLMERIKNAEVQYHFVEVMACPGGCLGGGGQVIPTNDSIRLKRMKAIYDIDEGMHIRRSHENPAVMELYREYLIRPLSERCYQLLHTDYMQRPKILTRD
ncbi:NADH-dependent [FeFe] hydrogenase, group A6 [Thermovenabulum sp.]|uniref:NADH-dependent [FeFe] hydrogenase, group A6 n=2 Tax=Thermovenabulum sp. TaxID=3100335 RepID=UPI003C79FC3A